MTQHVTEPAIEDMEERSATEAPPLPPAPRVGIAPPEADEVVADAIIEARGLSLWYGAKQAYFP